MAADTGDMPDLLLDRIAGYARRHGAPAPGEAVLALVSGGPDSTLLMHALAARHDGRVGVLAVDHGLRPEAARECGAVVEAARSLGLEAHVVRLGLAAGPGVQERAREARHAAARRVADEHGYAAIALGHTAGDQAETVLMRLARGTGRDGALGMAPRAGRLARPLLCVTAGEARDWCRARGLAVADDPANRDPAYTRVRARRLLREGLAGLHPDAERHVAAFADRLRDEWGLISAAVDGGWDRCARDGGLDAAALAREEPALARLLVRRLLAGAGLGGDALSGAAVDRVLGLRDGPPRVEVAGGVAVVRERGVVRVADAAGATPPEVPLEVPGRARFGERTLRASAGEGRPPAADRVAVAVDAPLVVRAPRPGDRVALAGGGRAAVGRLLAEGGVPSRLRHRVPVVATAERVVWVAGHRAAADLLAPPGSPAIVLELEAL